MQDIDALLDSAWWTDALIQRRALDVAAHDEGRAHQSVDPHAVFEPDSSFVPDPSQPDQEAPKVLRPTHGSADYTLTPWEQQWLTDRINAAHVKHLNARNDARAILQESPEEHEARELTQKAVDVFGASHEQTRKNIRAQKQLHQVHCKGCHAHLVSEDVKSMSPEREAAEREAMNKTIAAHEQTIAQLDEYDAFIDRHVATVKVTVSDQRQRAEKAVADCEKLLSVPHADHVSTHHRRVEAELRTRKD